MTLSLAALTAPGIDGLAAARTLAEPIDETLFLQVKLPTMKEIMKTSTEPLPAAFAQRKKFLRQAS